MKTTRMPVSICVSCGTPNDSASDPTDELTPEPGDVSICLRCGHIAIFDDELRPRALTDEEIIELAGNPEILRMQKARGKMML